MTVAGATAGHITRGLAVLAAVERGDGPSQAHWLARKLAGLRIFPDEAGDRAFDRDVRQVGGEILLVSNFTIAADCNKGRRPSLDEAAPPEVAQPLFEQLIAAVQNEGVPVRQGVFGADMQVHIENDGPVTLVVRTP